jgi:hypothetical protein
VRGLGDGYITASGTVKIPSCPCRYQCRGNSKRVVYGAILVPVVIIPALKPSPRGVAASSHVVLSQFHEADF